MKPISITLFFIILFTISCLPGNIYSQSTVPTPTPTSTSPLPSELAGVPPGVVPQVTPTKSNSASNPAEGGVVSLAAAGIIAAIIALF